MMDIRKRVENTFSSEQYVSRLSKSGKNWLGIDIATVLKDLQVFPESL